MSGAVEPVSVAVVGAGYWGKNYVRNLAHLPGANLRWVCDRDPQALARCARLAPGARLTAELDEVLADATVQAIVVATPAPVHAAPTIAALRAGKHVLVEKPMATTTSDAAAMVAAADAAGRTLMVGHLMLYHPAVERLQRMVRAGELGRIYYMYALRVNLGQVRRDENALWSFAPHDLSIIQCLLEQQPETVAARGHAYLQPGVEDVVFLNLDYPDQTMAQIQLSWLDPHKERRLTVVGSRKMVIFDDTHANEKLRVYDKGFDRPPDYESFGEFLALRDGDVHIPSVALNEPLAAECLHFLHCVRTGTPPRTSARDGLAVVKVLDAAARSLLAGGAPMRIAAAEPAS
ncbi:MAG: Gfo/Idh/MocA family oxidoreductase [Proteobacteria bacterium]|nr:Gfo/Idh/MocA family oxidoreductase [Pseudomonadota bacterium]